VPVPLQSAPQPTHPYETNGGEGLVAAAVID
jgi:hypothetical protein